MSSNSPFRWSGSGTGHAHIPRRLRIKWKMAVLRARKRRRLFGDPVDELIKALSGLVIDEDAWQELIDEPYA